MLYKDMGQSRSDDSKSSLIIYDQYKKNLSGNKLLDLEKM